MMPNHTEESPKSVLWAMLLLLAAGGALNALVGSRNVNAGHALGLLLQLLISYTAFVWYCRDSNARRYPRSLGRNMCFIGLIIVFLPWYLLRTRERGRKIASLFRLAAFLLLMLFAAIVGHVVGVCAGMLF